ncbi:MAG: hypothetical protein ACTHKT_06885 [Solirubrobacterales bacterium]
MRRRLKLLERAARAGWAWVYDYTDHAGRVLTLIALLLGTSTISAVQIGWWGPMAAMVVFGLLALGSGALNEWDKAEKKIEQEDFFQTSLASFEASCYQHNAKVERFLAARKAGGPPEVENLYVFMQEMDTPEGKRHGEEAKQYARQTVAAFIESEDLERGIGLIDFLIQWHFVNPATRQNVAEPKTIDDIKDGLLSIQWGAEHMPVYR